MQRLRVYDDILTKRQLQYNLNSLARKAQGWNLPTWTHQVKVLLAKLGRRAGYQTCTAGSIMGARWDKEWLYDLVWMRADEDFVVEDVALVAEIEWGGPREVQQDFQKLLLAQVDCRVMIFEDRGGLYERLIRQAESFRQRRRGDRYLFASFQDERFAVYEKII